MSDTAISTLIASETARQKNTLMMIPSENYTSVEVMKALGSPLTNKYSEGYAGKRYYQGNTVVDEIERLAISRARELFNVPHANVQPYSGSPANMAVYFALLEPGDVIMGMKLPAGGHLTHGHPGITFSGKYFTPVQYDVTPEGYIDMEAARQLALTSRPKIIVVGATAYPRFFDWEAWRALSDEVDALLLADISHIAGLVAGQAHPSPVPHVDIVMTTTHKTLRGPRGAMLMVTDRGLARDPLMGEKIDRAVFPGLQGGPHDNTTAAIAVALYEAGLPEFAKYAHAVVQNAAALAKTLTTAGFTLSTGGTDNHLLLLDLRPQKLGGNVVAEALEMAGIVVNRNSVPHDQNPPFYPSGIRLGTPALTTRGMGVTEMEKIGGWITSVVEQVGGYKLPDVQEERNPFMKKFRAEMTGNETLVNIAKDVRELCERFPLPY